MSRASSLGTGSPFRSVDPRVFVDFRTHSSIDHDLDLRRRSIDRSQPLPRPPLPFDKVHTGDCVCDPRDRLSISPVAYERPHHVSVPPTRDVLLLLLLFVSSTWGHEIIKGTCWSSSPPIKAHFIIKVIDGASANIIEHGQVNIIKAGHFN